MILDVDLIVFLTAFNTVLLKKVQIFHLFSTASHFNRRYSVHHTFTYILRVVNGTVVFFLFLLFLQSSLSDILLEHVFRIFRHVANCWFMATGSERVCLYRCKNPKPTVIFNWSMYDPAESPIVPKLTRRKTTIFLTFWLQLSGTHRTRRHAN